MRIRLVGFLLVLLIITETSVLKAQVSASDINNSVVKVSVIFKPKGEKKPLSSTGTGFFWQNKNQLVTSLHLLRNGYIKIVVKDAKGNKAEAKVSRIYKEMDLMLLSVDRPHASWDAFTKKDAKVKSKEGLMAVGFNSNSQAWFGKNVKAAFTSSGAFLPLQFILPSSAEIKSLQEQGFPSISKNMLSLEGSLLPGYSGGPIFNKSGDLVAVGDGGLENGASGISWGIPISHLDYLMSSQEKLGNINFEGLQLLYSTEVVYSGEDLLAEGPTPPANPSSDVIKSYKLESGYEFVYVKTRKLKDLISTSDDPRRINKILDEYAGFNFNLLNLEFEVYEEQASGIIFVTPKMSTIKIDFSSDRKSLMAKNIYYRVGMLPRGYFPKTMEEYLDWYKRDDDKEVLDAEELKTTHNGSIRYVRAKGLKEDKSQANFAYRKAMQIGENQVSAIGILMLTGLEDRDLTQDIKTQSRSGLPQTVVNRIFLKAIMDINMTLMTISNTKVKRSEPLRMYTWKSKNLRFGIPSSVLKDSVSSSSTAFRARNKKLIFSVIPEESDTPFTAEMLETKLRNLTSRLPDQWQPYQQGELNEVHDLDGLVGATSFLHVNKAKTSSAMLMYVMDPAKPKTLLKIRIIFDNSYIDTALDMINSIKQIDR